MSEKPTYEELEQRVKELKETALKCKPADDALIEREKRYRFILENVTDVIWIVDMEMKFTYFSPSVKKMRGYSVQEAMVQSVEESMTPASFESAMKIIAKELELHNKAERAPKWAWKMEAELICKDGSTVWTEIEANFINNSEGQPTGILGITRNITERKEAEKAYKQAADALRESEEKYRNVLENIEDGYYEVDTAGDFTFFNQSMCRILGYEADELMGKNNREYMEEENAKEVFQIFHEVYQTGVATKALNWKLIKKDGSECFVETVVSLLTDSDSNKVGFRGIARDVSDRKQTEIEKEQLLSQLQATLEATVDGIIVVGLDGKINIFSKRFRKIMDMPDSILNSKDANQALTYIFGLIKDSEVFSQKVQSAFNSQSANTFDTLYLKDGRVLEAYSRPQKLRDKIIGRVWGFRDVTKRKLAQKALQESETRLKTIFDVSPAGIILVDPQGVITYANLGMAKMFGCTQQELIGSSYPEHVHPDQRNIGDQRMRQLIAGEVDSVAFERHYIRSDGTDFWGFLSGRRHEEDQGKLISLVGIISDITEEKTLENELRQSKKMEALGTLSGGIAHEFNNILGIIIGNAELAIDDVPEWNSAKDCLEEIRQASLRAKDVVRRIMSFSRKTPANRKPIKISSVIQESLKLTRAMIPANIEIQQEILCVSEMILANPTEINQVLINLCSNSFHAMEGGTGILKVRLEPAFIDTRSATLYDGLAAGKCVKLTVKDTGVGIDPKNMGSIFDPYFTTKDVDKGLGMGLSIVYGIVKKHDGAIKIKSEVGKGTTVEILFPVTEETAEVMDEASNDLPTGTERILFVDDEVSLVKLVKQMLERQGYKVEGKTSSTEALELFREESRNFDLVITDMAMPVMPGDLLAKELIHICPSIPIIVCTGHSDRIDENMAKKLGIRAYTMKPFVKTELIKTVRKVLDEAKGQSKS